MAHHLEAFYLHLKGIEGYLLQLARMNGIQRILHQSSIEFRIDQLARRLEDLRSTWMMMVGMETHRVLSGIKEDMSQQSPHSSVRNRSGLLVVHEDEMYIQKRLNTRHRGWFSGAALASVNGVDRLVKTYNMPSTNQDFLAEVRRLRQFRHPNLPQIFGVSDDHCPAAFIVFHQAVQSRDISTLINFYWRTENKFVITMMTLRLILDLKLVASYLLDSGLVDVQELGSILLPRNLWLDTNGTLLLGDATTRSPRDPSRTPNKGQDVTRGISNFIYDLTPELIGISLRPLNPNGLPRTGVSERTPFALFSTPPPCHGS
ncbi:hypothetical protein BS47DRAFT_513296 [Hydnum rufescens UP504]|uniref:Uncharacterized protein n=1 Tax=Hydnum rufescens UP504 TaxID=1448309 RepID=A0A9P6AHL9_9AGAM|nr:hypothetical protein BS47DRAFT_513296 [Hydnum rufescens UP504]